MAQQKLVLSLIGKDGSGKTMLSLKLCDPDATYVPDGMAPGLVSFAIWRSQLSGQSLRVQINRTRQMQRNIAISDPFFKGSQGIICVCDVSDADSFDYVKAFVPQARQQHPSLPVVLVANKIDAAERQVDSPSLRSFADSHGIPFFETSALQNLGIDAPFARAASDAAASRFAGIGVAAAPAQAAPANSGCDVM